MQTDRALFYIRAIRNKAKKEYAGRYWKWLASNGNEADRPEQPIDLGCMAAQAVRMHLQDFAGQPNV